MKMKNICPRGAVIGALGWMLAALLTTGLFIDGCGNNPSAPENNLQDARAPMTVDPVLKKLGDLEYTPADKCREVSAVAYPGRNAKVWLGWGSRLNSFIVPRGAVEEKTLIEINSCFIDEDTDGNIELIEFEFLPDGLRFSRAAQLVLDAGLIGQLKRHFGESNLVKLYWLNPETGEWELYQEARIIGRRVVFKISHFSKFGISR
jgi:hypothetical protein